MPAPSRPFTVRNVQFARAALAAVAALMITFSPDHSAAVGLAVFGGFGIVTAVVLVLGAGLAYPAGRRWPMVVLAVLTLAAGMAGSVPAWRSDDLFFALVISWALLTGLAELLSGIRYRGEPYGRDAVIIGALGLLLGAALLLIPSGFVQPYTIDEAGSFELTGTILGVGMFGAYAAIVAVFLGIAAATPRPKDAEDDDPAETDSPSAEGEPDPRVMHSDRMADGDRGGRE